MDMTLELHQERREFCSKILKILDVIKSVKQLKAEFRSGRKNTLRSAGLKSFWELRHSGNIFYYFHPQKLPPLMNYLSLWLLVLRPGLPLHCLLALAVLTLPVLMHFPTVTSVSSASEAQQARRRGAQGLTVGLHSKAGKSLSISKRQI